MGRVSVTTGVVLLLLVLAGTSGCRGRAAYFRGEELARQGRDREAYYEFWEAYSQGRSPQYREALERTGRRVALSERAEIQRLERGGELEVALERVSLALEYAPRAALLSEDYARLSRYLLDWQDLSRQLEGRRSESGDGWAVLDLLRTMAHHPGRPPEWRTDWATAVRLTIEAELAPLRRKTFEAPLAYNAKELDELAAAWARATSRTRGLLREGIPDRGVQRVTQTPELQALLLRTLVEASWARGQLAAGRRGFALLREAAQLEEQGLLTAAYRALTRASVENEGLHEARAARSRVFRAFCADRYEAAEVAMRRGDWTVACERWDELRALAGDYRDAVELESTARRRQADERALRARRYREAGLYGNALVYYYLVLQTFPRDVEARRMAHDLEGVLTARARPRITLSDTDATMDWGAEFSLASIDVDAFRERLRRRVVAVFGGGDDAPAVGSRIASPKDGFVLTLERVTVATTRLKKSAVFERTAFVERFRMTQNPARRSARTQLKEARRHLGARLSQSWQAGRDAFSTELLTLAQWRLRGAEIKIAALPEEITALSWDDSFYQVEHVSGATRVTATYRFGAATHEVTSDYRIQDRVVLGDPDRSVPRDPAEMPSKRQILRVLAGRLGEAIARDTKRRLAVRQEQLLEDARKRFAEGALDLATESVVAFLLAHRGTRSERVTESLELLREMTGCDLTVHWDGV
jgi:hypothetical protein